MEYAGHVGIELLRSIRELGRYLPFVFVTTECTNEMRLEAADAGADYLISKPFTAEHFQIALNTVPAMSALPKLPDVTVIGTLLSGILGRKVVVAKAPPLDLGPKVAKVFGVYREAATGRICLCVVDLVFAANAAGAMLVFPPYAVATAIRAGKLDNDLMETIRKS